MSYSNFTSRILPGRRSLSVISGICLLLIVILFTSQLYAEYLWPLPYGKELSSAFGDWRARHYHAGLDIRTGGAVGLAVVAPADGYVMRLSTAYYGYGKALYYKIDDGNVAVFGHLDHFRPEVEEYVAKEQIKSESYNQNLILRATLFRYQRGDTICYSGQSGVGAPHLHFEVRTAENQPLNPLSFDGLKVADSQSPEIRRLRLIGKWNDDLERALGHKLDYAFIKKPGQKSFVLNDTVECDWGDFWLSVEAIDRVGINTWPKPIYSLELRQANRLLYRLTYDTLSFDDTYLIDMERNYQMAMRGSTDFYNLVSVKQVEANEGVCRDADGGDKSLTLIARDIAGNESRATVPLRSARKQDSGNKGKPEYARLAALLQRNGDHQDDIQYAFIPDGDRLSLLVRQLTTKPVEFKVSLGLSTSQSVALQNLGGGFAFGVVDSVDSADLKAIPTSFTLIRSAVGNAEVKQEYTLPAGFRRAWSGDQSAAGHIVSQDGRLQIEFPPMEQAFFPLDRQYYFEVEAKKTLNGVDYAITPNDFPLAKQVTASYAFDQAIPRGAGLYLGEGEHPSFLGCEVDSTHPTITAKSYRLGTISMRVDTILPTIREVNPSANATVASLRPTVRCKIGDNLSGIRDSVEVRIDGRWCIPVYDPEAGTLTSTAYFDLTPGKHRLGIAVTDRVGNTKRVSSEFNVGPTKAAVGSKKKHGK